MGSMILSLNGGSSSLKFAVYRMSATEEERIFSGAVEAIGEDTGKTWLRRGDDILSEENGTFTNHTAAVNTMFAALHKQGIEKLAAAG
ncbi:MAG: ackA, partial [Candidatus Angelobacter sp.]|nr:ackA [Candidatus Angelobacter sp.]